MSFNDYFSKQAGIYQKARPTYPDELFQFLAQLAPGNRLCWDCATGNGQAAKGLAPYFEKIIATDGSAEQIAKALPVENVEYRVALAEESGLPDHSADLITVATAAHWFNHTAFYSEAQRVIKPGGILAVWTYSEALIEPHIDSLMKEFMYGYLLSYWPAGRQYVIDKYETLPFPFTSLATPSFYCERSWKREQWLNYVKSWSSYNNFLAREGKDPLQQLLPALTPLWPAEETKTVRWKLHLKCARIGGN